MGFHLDQERLVTFLAMTIQFVNEQSILILKINVYDTFL